MRRIGLEKEEAAQRASAPGLRALAWAVLAGPEPVAADVFTQEHRAHELGEGSQ